MQTADGRKKIAKEIVDNQGHSPEADPQKVSKAIEDAEAQAKQNNEPPLSEGEKQQIADHMNRDAQKDYDKKVDSKAKELESKRMRDERSVTVVEHKDGTSTVGVSGNDKPGGQGRTKDGQNLADVMNERYGTDEYHSTSNPVKKDGLSSDPTSNPAGQCSEPHAAQGAGEYAGDDPGKAPESYQTVWAGDNPPPAHTRADPASGAPETLPGSSTQTMNPCPTCQKNAVEGDKYGDLMSGA